MPLPRLGVQLAAYKVSKRFDQDISAVCGAFALTRDGDRVSEIRLGYGGMAAIPKRASAAEAALRGKPWTLDSVRQAMDALDEDFQPLSDCRGSARYRAPAGMPAPVTSWAHAPSTPAASGAARSRAARWG